MSNGAHTAPRAERRRVENNTPMPSGLGAAEETLASVIGQTVAVHLAQMLGPMLQQMPWQPACAVCIRARKQAERGEAGEELPGVAQAVTWLPMGVPGQPANVLPVCYEHFQIGPAERPVGLVAPTGQPIVARA